MLKKLTQRETINQLAEQLINSYQQHYSVSNLLTEYNLRPGARPHIEVLLKERGIYQGLTGLSAKHKHQRLKKTMLERYGVENYGQLSNGGYSALNAIEKESLIFPNQLLQYRERVTFLTNKNKKRLVKGEYCYYTGIKFIDDQQQQVNPNENRKRSVDHKISTWIGFVSGMPAEEIAATSNLVWCLKYCNNIKGNMNIDDFVPYASLIRELFINEGVEHN